MSQPTQTPNERHIVTDYTTFTTPELIKAVHDMTQWAKECQLLSDHESASRYMDNVEAATAVINRRKLEAFNR